MSKCNFKAKEAIKAATQSARRAVEEHAARTGVKIKRRTLNKDEVKQASSNKFTEVTNSFERLGKELERRFRGQSMFNKNEVKILHNNVRSTLRIEDPNVNVVDWINEVPSLAPIRAQQAREAFTREFDTMAQRVEDLNTDNPSDKNFVAGKQIIADTKDEMEALMDWTAMLNDNRYTDLAKLDPRWSMLSREYEEAMDVATRDAIHKSYDAMSQRLISNQFGKLTESLGTKLFRSKVPLAEWMAMNILEMPMGTGGAVKRTNTAAVVSQIMQAEIEVPLNKAYFDMMTEAAKELGYGRAKRLMMQWEMLTTRKWSRTSTNK